VLTVLLLLLLMLYCLLQAAFLLLHRGEEQRFFRLLAWRMALALTAFSVLILGSYLSWWLHNNAA